MAKERILFLTHAYYNKGGVEEHIRDLSKVLNNEIDVYILTPVQNGNHQHFQLLRKGIIQQIFPGNFINWPLTPYKDNLASYAIEKSIELARPQIIHIHHLQNWPLETLNNIISTKIPSMMTIHDYFLATPLFTMEFSNHPKELLTKEYSIRVFGGDISEYLIKRREVITSSLNQLKILITPSKNAKTEMEKVIPTEYKVVPHGIRYFNVRKKISATANKIRFGYIGSIIRQKGWLTLVESFKKTFERHKNIELHMYGDGYDKEKLINQPDIHYHGKFTKKDLGQILSTFDIGIIPSIFKETFCYTLAEMQYANLPVIASKIGALTEKIDDSNGKLFIPGDKEDLSAKIGWFINNFTSKNWDINKPRSIEEMKDDYINIYQSLM